LRTHAGIALIGAAIADQQLQDALLTKMRKLSRKLQDELFSGYGPLSSLSAKIALAYALGLIDSVAHKRLTVARQIRNKFAHSGDIITFASPEIGQLLAKFPSDYEKSITNEFLYLWHLQQAELNLVESAGTDICKPSSKVPPDS
jgi:DNA-binding MltR family transcriptional regulator